MYRIIGADQKQYGPVSANRVRQWIVEGRADAQTQTRVEDGTEWKPLGEFPEFADVLAAKTAGTPPPQLDAGPANRGVTDIPARRVGLDISDCFSRSWGLLKDNLWLLVGANAVIFLMLIGLESIPFIGHAAGVVLAFVLAAGLDLVFLKRIRRESADLGQAFSGFTIQFAPLMLASVLAHVLTFIGLLACVVPGIYLLVAWWMFVPLLVIDKGLDFWPAMEASRKMVNRNWWPCFGLFLLAGVVSLVGAAFLLVGFFITLPLAVGATVYAYEDLFGSPAQAVAPSPAGAVATPSPTPESAPSGTPAGREPGLSADPS
jgi:hypothetical protein